MSIDGPQHVATQTDPPASQRRTFLDVLSLEIRHTYGLGAGVVTRAGCMVLYVADGGSMHSAEIACDMTSEGWWFAWAEDGRTIAPVEDVTGTARLVARTLRVAWPLGCTESTCGPQERSMPGAEMDKNPFKLDLSEEIVTETRSLAIIDPSDDCATSSTCDDPSVGCR